MADTTTTLNTGSGGDKMDESEVLQSDAVTLAKRPRVVLGGDAGYDGTVNDLVQPINADPGTDVMALPAMNIGLVNDTPNTYIVGEVRPFSLTSEGRLRVTSVQASTYMDMFGDTGPIATDPDEFSVGTTISKVNPWGI